MDRDSRLDLLEQQVRILMQQTELHTEHLELVSEISKEHARSIADLAKNHLEAVEAINQRFDIQKAQIETTLNAVSSLADLIG